MTKETGHKRLGEILLEHGALTENKLNEALKEQKSQGGLIGEVLIRLGYVTEENIVIALASQFNFPYLPIDNFEINPQAVKTIPAELASEFICIPIDQIKNTLTVAMSDPSNTNVIQKLETASGCRIQPFVATVTEIKKAIARFYKITLPDDDKASTHVSQISFRVAREKKESDNKEKLI